MNTRAVGAYYFPNYHVDSRNEAGHGKGWTEWDLVRRATPRFPGHRQPLIPAWGFEDEADPRVMARKIQAAADHGLNFWIFDWYWYDDGPFLERCLNDGFLKAANNARMKFCLMWANHDWIEIHPHKKGAKPQLLYPGRVTPRTFDTITDHVVRDYFCHPSHFTIAGRPYFSIYELGKFVASFGSLPDARAALDAFRRKTTAAGFPGLHLNAVAWGRPILPGESTPVDPARVVRELGFDSVTSYVWVHHVGLNASPYTPYTAARDDYLAYWAKARATFDVPYFPNVTMGWDSSPRTEQDDVWEPVGYPFTNILSGNTPAQFREALETTRRHYGDQRWKIVTINAWNEWTEGSYLEPDTVNGMAYLDAIKSVFRAWH
ncbi:MAG: glycoside hydrolase family 99-like domain-containing protein [Lentisphaerae bacterium]|nr:glycoside hydrolase family 99-like domain-containing protein [Lentisphaerota bacterium]